MSLIKKLRRRDFENIDSNENEKKEEKLKSRNTTRRGRKKMEGK